MTAKLPPAWANTYAEVARRNVSALRALRHRAGPPAVSAWPHRMTASQARAALALAIATEGWSDEAKSAIDPRNEKEPA